MADSLECRVSTIEERNARVERDKAWEISSSRKLLIMFITYSAGAFLFYRLGSPQPLINALVPAMGYVISTLSLPAVKRWWLKKKYML